MPRKKKPLEPEGVFRMEINGHSLSGRKVGGRWEFVAPEFPDLVRTFNGTTDTTGIVWEFARLCLAGSPKVSSAAVR